MSLENLFDVNKTVTGHKFACKKCSSTATIRTHYHPYYYYNEEDEYIIIDVVCENDNTKDCNIFHTNKQQLDSLLRNK